MKTKEQIKEAIENNKKYLEEEYPEDEEVDRIEAVITALEWVLSGEASL